MRRSLGARRRQREGPRRIGAPAVGVEQVYGRDQAGPFVDDAAQRVKHSLQRCPGCDQLQACRSPRSSVPSSVAFEDITTFTLPDIPLGISLGIPTESSATKYIVAVDGSRAAVFSNDGDE